MTDKDRRVGPNSLHLPSVEDLRRMRSAGAIISDDHRGYTLHEVIQIAVPDGIEQIGICMRVRIDEPGADNQCGRVNHAGCLYMSLDRITDKNDAILTNADISLDGISTGAIQHLAAFDQQIDPSTRVLLLSLADEERW